MRYILVFLLLFSSLMADRDGGPYIGVGYGTSSYDDGGLYNELKKETSNSATFYFGAYINKYLSVELGYVSFDAWQTQKGYEVSDTQNIGFGSLTVSTLAHYAFFDDVLDFYGRFGVGEITASSAVKKGFTMVVGAGMGVRFNEWLSMKLAYDQYQFNYDQDDDSIDDYEMRIDHIYSAIEVQF